MKIDSKKLAAKNGKLVVTLSCSEATCSGTGKIATIKKKVKRKGKTHVKHKTVTIATGSYSLAANTTGTATLKLTGKGKTLLSRRHAHIKGKLTITVTNGTPATKRVKVT